MGTTCGKPGSNPIKELKWEKKENSHQMVWYISSRSTISIHNTNSKIPRRHPEDRNYMPQGNFGVIKHIPDTNYLITSNHNSEKGSFAVFNIDNNHNNNDELKLNKIYSFQKKHGIVNDFAFNTKREILTILSINNDTLYHLFDLTDFQFVKKGAWPERHSADVTSLDLDPLGLKLASMDNDGTCCITDITSDALLFSINTVRVSQAARNICRWNPDPNNPFIAVRFEKTRLNLVDTEEQRLFYRASVVVDANYTHTMEWSNGGSLLALAGSDKTIKIMDYKEKKIIKEIPTRHREDIRCLQWSPDSTMIATTSEDDALKLFDIGTGKLIFQSNTWAVGLGSPEDNESPNKNTCSPVCFL